MPSLRNIVTGLRSLFRKERVERELDEELRAYQEMAAEEKMKDGISRKEALRAVRLEQGTIDATKEVVRAGRWESFVETCWQDLRFAARMLRKNPAFTTVAVLTLALGIGANSGIFSFVNGVILQPLPYPRPDRLVSITDSFPQGAIAAMQANVHSMDVAGYLDGQDVNLSGLAEPVRLSATAVSANFFSLLGVEPEQGRVFLPGEDHLGQDAVVILSHNLWEQKFGGSSVVGRSITLDGTSRQVVGVMPPGFQFAASKAECWIPLHLDERNVGAYWGGGFMPLVGRLRSSFTREQALAELHGQLARMRAMFPWKMPDALWSGVNVAPLQADMVGDAAPKLQILLAATGLVLLIACVNVAGLHVARSAARRKEIAMRTALGARQWRICRQLLAESILLGLLGGGLGLALAIGVVSWLKQILPADVPRLATVSLDWHVVGWTAAIALAAGILLGIAPTIQVWRADVIGTLKSGAQNPSSKSSHRLRGALVTAEMALAIVLLVCAGLTVRSLWELAQVHPGFRTESIVTARITPNQGFCASLARCQNFYNEVVQQARALPGVKDVALVNILPLTGRVAAFAADLEGHPRDPSAPASVLFHTVITPDYLRLMDIPLIRGREFTEEDMASNAPGVALVTAESARKFWPNEDPIGKHLKRVGADWITVVGEVADVNEQSLASKFPAYIDGAIYAPYGNGVGPRYGIGFPANMTLVVRTISDRATIAPALRRAVSGLNADVPVSDVRTLRTVVSESESASRSTALLFVLFAGLALVMSAIGVYGVASNSVTQRAAEIGLRMALGARPGDLFRMILGQGARLALIGEVIGLAGALAAARVMSSLLFHIAPRDPLTFAAVAIVLMLVALLACYLPARRAMRVDPMVALRYE